MVDMALQKKKDEFHQSCRENRKAMEGLIESLKNLTNIGSKEITIFVKKVRCEDEKRHNNDRDI